MEMKLLMQVCCKTFLLCVCKSNSVRVAVSLSSKAGSFYNYFQKNKKNSFFLVGLWVTRACVM